MDVKPASAPPSALPPAASALTKMAEDVLLLDVSVMFPFTATLLAA
jgi:hypothetical protein